MKFNKYIVEGNCIIRTFTKLFNKTSEEVYNELLELTTKLNKNDYTDIEVWEEYLFNNNYKRIDNTEEIKVKELKLDNSKYAVFCWDKKDLYHIIPIINNIVYDKTNKSLELYTLRIYKNNNL